MTDRLKDELTVVEVLQTCIEVSKQSDEGFGMMNEFLRMVQAPVNADDQQAMQLQQMMQGQLKQGLMLGDTEGAVCLTTVARLIKQDNLERIEQLLSKKLVDLHQPLLQSLFPVNHCQSVDMLNLFLRYGLDLARCVNDQVCPLSYVPMPVFLELLNRHQLCLADWYIRATTANKHKIGYMNDQVAKFRAIHCPILQQETDLPIVLCHLVCDYAFLPLFKSIKQQKQRKQQGQTVDQPALEGKDRARASTLCDMSSFEHVVTYLAENNTNDSRISEILGPISDTLRTDPQSAIDQYNEAKRMLGIVDR